LLDVNDALSSLLFDEHYYYAYYYYYYYYYYYSVLGLAVVIINIRLLRLFSKFSETLIPFLVHLI